MSDEPENKPGASGEAVAKVLDHVRRCEGYGDNNHVKGITDATGLSRRTTYRALQILEDYNLIRRERDGNRRLVLLNGWDEAGEVEARKPMWNA